MNRNSDGAQGEILAAHFLERQGLELVEKNYRCRLGEIDLVCREGKTVVFVEVRLRRRGDFGGAAASITPHKQRRILGAAKHYLAGKNIYPPCRFDAVLLDGAGAIEWIRNAFGE